MATIKPAEDNDAPFEVGEVVWIKSGSNPMTVYYCDDQGAKCIWAVEGEKRTGAFPVSVLTADRPTEYEDDAE